jgi:hypothetical protein
LNPVGVGSGAAGNKSFNGAPDDRFLCARSKFFGPLSSRPAARRQRSADQVR